MDDLADDSTGCSLAVICGIAYAAFVVFFAVTGLPVIGALLLSLLCLYALFQFLKALAWLFYGVACVCLAWMVFFTEFRIRYNEGLRKRRQ